MAAPLILLVEDDEADVILFQRSCRKQGLSADIVVARDGMEALDYLRRPDRPPGRMVIVTDLNMPRLNGHELMEALREDPSNATHVVFVLSTSNLPQDLEAAYRGHAAGYIVKDARGDRFAASIAMLRQYFEAITLN
jgi:CheY-like chemotaxis protein